MRPTSFKSDKDLKKLDESKLRLALCQYRETLVLMNYQLGGGNHPDEQMEHQVKEFSEELDGIIAELHRRQQQSPKLMLHKREPLRTENSENIRPPSSKTRPGSYPSFPSFRLERDLAPLGNERVGSLHQMRAGRKLWGGRADLHLWDRGALA